MCLENPTNLVDTLRQAIQQAQSGTNSFGPIYDEELLEAKLRSIVANLPSIETQRGQPTVEVSMTIPQADAVCEALDVYSRLCIGQLTIVSEMVSRGVIPVRMDPSQDRKIASVDQCHRFEDTMNHAKDILGYARGASMGIANNQVSAVATKGYEVMKVMQRAVAIYRNPTPSFETVSYDGLSIRVTKDPEPKARVMVPS